MRTLFLAPALLLAVCLVASGCQGQKAEGYAVSGTVTFKGKPVPRGSLLFSPDSQKGNSGPAISFEIVDGQYGEIEQTPRLHQGGVYRVRISGFDGNANPAAELPLGRPLFHDHTTSIDLPKEDAPETNFELP